MVEANDERALIEAKIDAILDEFERSMDARTQLTVRIGKRVTQLVRIAIFGILIVTLAMFYLVHILSRDVTTMTEHMEVMDGHMRSMESDFEAVATYMGSMRASIDGMQQAMTSMSPMTESVVAMDRHMTTMQTNMETIEGDIRRIEIRMGWMDRDVTGMERRLRELNTTVYGIGGNVNDMSDPFRLLPFPR